ncbi:MAG: tripartite tricarboxylate transporter substrate binding protein, partial [Comamonadaceae bacterium]
MKRVQFLQGIAIALCVAASSASLAQSYPVKPIRLIVPFPAGGATDLFARTLSQKMGEKLGTTLVVDNKPGAGGAIGSDQAAKAAPDGYTLLLATTSTHSVGPAITPKLPYDTVRDFTPIAHVGDAPSIMLVPNSSPAKTVREWIDYAKKNPGKLNYASSGNGTIVQLTAELFKSQAGVFVTHIPYKGTALAIPDLISGKVDVLFDSLP